MKSLKWSGIILLFSIFATISNPGFAQTNEAEWNGFGYSLKKVVSNTSIPSGVNFSYTILFTAPAGATSVSIQDMIPASLEVVPPFPVPAAVCGTTPSLTVTGPIGSQTVNYNLTGLPTTCAASGSFTIVVKFKEGTTCNGEAARNRAEILVNDKWQPTPYVSTTAIANDPWKVSKSILSGAFVNPSGGSCGYMMSPDDTVKYRVYVMKNSPYWGNVSGQMNMTNATVTDILPAGAVMISNTCGATQVGSTITWDVNSPSQLLDAANPYAYAYCDFEIYYPAASFPVGATINNEVTLSGTICNQQVSHTSNQTCIEVLNFTPNQSANFQKYISLTNRVPGCSGVYTIVFCNNGNVALSAFDINDAIPAGVSVDQIAVYNSAGSPLSLNLNGSLHSTIASTSYNTGPLAMGVNNIQLQMTGSLPVSSCIYMYVYFTIEPNPTGTVITNCANFDGLANSLTLQPTCVDFTVEAGAPKPCLIKDICSPATSYEPGDILRFRLRVQNIGSADLTGAAIQDVLHSNFSYLGNESYYVATTYNPACSSGGSLPSGTTAWPGVSPSHSGNNLSWSLPDIGSDCQLFYTAYCGAYGTSSLPYHFIEFDVAVDSLAMPGVTPNSYDISGGNLTSTVTSNTVNVLVVASFGQEVTKQVSIDGGTTFNSTGTVNQGASARFRLNYKNLSNVPVTEVQMVDLLGRNDGTNDWLVLNRSVPRGSQFDLSYNLNHSTSTVPTGIPPTLTLDYSSILNACLPAYGINLGCNANTWTASPANNIRMDYGSYNLAPGTMLKEDFDIGIPASAMVNQTVCNDFAALVTANFLLNGTPQTVTLTPIAAPPICLTVDTVQVSCCDSISVRQMVDADGTALCCVEFSATCELDSVKVTVTNGTLVSNSWTCGTTMPAAAIGQSTYTFASNNCVVDMTNCIQADQTGAVTVLYNAYFTNGERCEKEIQMDCNGGGGECCENIKLESVQSDDGCCVRLVTACEVESVEVTVGNGLISSANWNCGSLSPGYVGQSNYTFNANACVVDMTTCVSAFQTGIVTLNYTITFVNGEKCEKSIELDCVHQDDPCCALVDFKLKHKWPYWNNLIGVFDITNLDPSSPICYVEISPSPSASMSSGNLFIDGSPSTQVWNPTRIPSSGTLSPAAYNDIKFTLQASGYNGVINVCVVKCDSTRCCFEFKWNSKPWGHTGVPIEEYNPVGELVGVSISPGLSEGIDTPVKYVSFGLSSEKEVLESDLQLWAVSTVPHEGEASPDGLASTTASYMGKYSAFFELHQARSAADGIGIFNLVFAGGLPDLGCTLFDMDGNIISSGVIDITGGTNVSTSVIIPDGSQLDMFEFVKIHPNPSEGSFTLTYTSGKTRDVKIQIMDSHGRVVYNKEQYKAPPGVHLIDLDASFFAAGIYRVILSSEGVVLNKSAVLK